MGLAPERGETGRHAADGVARPRYRGPKAGALAGVCGARVCVGGAGAAESAAARVLIFLCFNRQRARVKRVS